MKRLLSTGVLMAVIAVASTASAQQYVGGASLHATNGTAHSLPGFGYGGYGYGDHSSTFEEGVLRGAADLRRAQGEANYFNSLAAINLQEANARALVNRQQRIEGFFRERELNRAARKASQPKPLSPAGYAELARKAAPDRLGPNQYDRASGRLTWPPALAAGEFAAERTAIEMALATRTPGDAGPGTDLHRQVQQATERMQANLQPQIATLSPMEFVAAKKFLSSLAFEAQQPLIVEGLATK